MLTTLLVYQGKARRRLSRGVLTERMKVLDDHDHQTGNVFHGFKPVASSAEL